MAASRGTSLSLDWFDWFFIALIFVWAVFGWNILYPVGFFAVYLLLDIRTHIIRGRAHDKELHAPGRSTDV